MTKKLKAPFPWFGGKSRVADLVWERFGDVGNYVEPFYGSGAVLLARPHEPRSETVNDLDCYVANFWRCFSDLRRRPTERTWKKVAAADWPVNECDLQARHQWLVNQTRFRAKMRRDPFYYDARIAGLWVWGLSQWIGGGWCARPEWTGRSLAGRQPRGIHTDAYQQRPALMRGNGGVQQKRPDLKRGGRGVQGRLPDLHGRDGATGKGVHASGQLPQLSGSGRGVQTQAIREHLEDCMAALHDRLRRVRVCCGDWRRILGPSPTTCIGLTGIFLDPPYSKEAGRDTSIYSHDCLDVGRQVAAWASEHGEDPRMRIAVCGYEGEHVFPDRWECLAWKANGGYGNQADGKGRANAGRERIWFSPHCLRGKQADLFA